MTEKLREASARDATPPEANAVIIYDTEVVGFGLRVTARGAKAFVLNYRFNGKERRLTIGRYPTWSVTAARKQASELRRQIDRGDDPSEAARQRAKTPSIDDVFDRYIGEYLPKKAASSQRNDSSMLKEARPYFRGLKVSDVRHADIEALHRRVSERAPFRANRMVALLSRIFSLAIKWELRADNPTKGIERNPENQRTRYLDQDELLRMSQALAALSDQRVANALRLLLLTGARKTEVLSATWSMFDLEKGVWLKPYLSTKQRRDHRVPLSGAAVELLMSMQNNRTKSPFLFPSSGRMGHLVDIKKSWSHFCQRAELNNMRTHDLRHTFASYIASSGASLQTVGALLGHSQPHTTQRYAHLQDTPLRAAAETAAAAFVPSLKGSEDEAT